MSLRASPRWQKAAIVTAWLGVAAGLLAAIGAARWLAAMIRAPNGVEAGICLPLGGLLVVASCTLGPSAFASLCGLWRRSARLFGAAQVPLAYQPPTPIVAPDAWLARVMQDTRAILRDMDHVARAAAWWPSDGSTDGWAARWRRFLSGSRTHSLADFAEVNRVTRDVWEWLRSIESLPPNHRADLHERGVEVAVLRATLLADADFHDRFVAMVGLLRGFERRLLSVPTDPFRGVGATRPSDLASPDADRERDREQADGGRRRTYEALVRRRRRSLRALAAKYARTPSEREDLEQEILVAIWKALPDFRGQSSLATYAQRIAYTTAVDHARRRRREVPEVDVIDPGPSPEDATAAALDGARLHAAIDRLPAPLREVLLLHLGGHGYRAIAAQTGTTEGNVGARLTRARDRLRRRLSRFAHA